MNLQNLFEIQKELDEHVEEKHPRKKGEDRLAKKILALQVELGECANEWRGFKFWKKNREPRTAIEVFCGECQGTGTPIGIPEESGVDCWKCEGAGSYFKNPLLEEYVDCLHFILSIGLELGVENYKILPHKQETITDQFIELNYQTYLVLQRNENNKGAYKSQWHLFKGPWYLLIDLFIGLGEMLGFTWEQIEQAYLAKNKINHERQESGY